MRLINPIVLAVVAVLVACKRDAVFVEISDSTYIHTMVALRKLPIGMADTAFRARQRDSVLRVMGVTATQLEAIAIKLSEDPARAAVIFRAIENPSGNPPP